MEKEKEQIGGKSSGLFKNIQQPQLYYMYICTNIVMSLFELFTSERKACKLSLHAHVFMFLCCERYKNLEDK